MAINGKLLYRGYKFSDRLTLDLYGEVDDEGYAVLDAALPGSDIGLEELLTYKQLEDMGYWLDRHMQDDMEHLIDRAEQDRLLCQGDHLWRRA